LKFTVPLASALPKVYDMEDT